MIYSWYLLYFTPFLLTVGTIPLVAWTITALPTYVVWRLAYDHGAPWVVPPVVLLFEFGIPIAIAVFLLTHTRSGKGASAKHAVDAETAGRGQAR